MRAPRSCTGPTRAPASAASKRTRSYCGARPSSSCDGPAWAGGNFHGLHGLFEACNAISTLKYEGKEGVGRLVLAHPEHPALRVDLELLTPVPLRDFSAVRKLLQLATDD